MEDILGWSLIALIPLSIVVLVYGIKQYIKYREHKQVESHKKWWAETEAVAAVMREEARQEMARAKDRATRLNLKTPTSDSVSQMKKHSSNLGPGTSSSNSSSSSSNLDFFDGVLTATIVNSLINNISHASEPGSSSSSNWGLDDSASQKSISDSMSDSWTSSSSDSGPSSDW